MLITVAGACSSERPTSAETGRSIVESAAPCPTPSWLGGLPASFPAQLALPREAQLTSLLERGGYTLATGHAPGSVPAVLAHFREAVAGAGYVVEREEDEGRGAQLAFFGATAEGSVTIARSRCPPGATAFTVTARRNAAGPEPSSTVPAE